MSEYKRTRRKVEVVQGGCGCIGLMLTCFALWALFFGVTINGKHHQVGCSCKNGVMVE